jgi:uncharacterized protein (TIGR02099 family)
MRHHITRATRHLIFWSLVMAAIGLSAVRLVLLGVDSYKTNLEIRVGAMLGTPVKLGSLGANMRGISPEVVAKDITIASSLATAPSAIQLKEIRLGINLGEFLLSRNALASSWVTLVGAKLSVIRKKDGQFVVEGLKAGGGEPLWLLQGRKYEVLQSQITWQDQQTGGAPIVLDPVNLVVMNDGNRHRINLLAQLPMNVGDGLKMLVDFEGEANKLSDIKGNVFFEGNKVNLHELVSTYLPFDMTITGSADVKVWGQWQQTKLVSIKMDMQLKQGIVARKGKKAFNVNALDTQLNWQVKDNEWQLGINHFLLESSENGKKSYKKWPDAIVSVAGETNSDGGFQKLKLLAKQLDLAEASKLLEFFAPLSEKQVQMVGKSKVSGVLRDFSLYAEPDVKGYAVAGWFDGISVEPMLSVPGIENLSGQVKGSDSLGSIAIDSQATHFNAPKIFSKPLLLNKLQGILNWQQSDEQWTISSVSVALDCPGVQVESRLLIKLPKNEESPFIDIQASLKSDDISQLRAYLPTKILQEKVNAWLEPAFVAGKVSKGDLLFYGKASDFPYTDNSGVFEIKLDLDKAELNYHPEWPHISGIDGEVLFIKDDILGSFKRGLIGKVDITKADMLISSLSNNTLLTINGDAQGDINQALSVLQQSPLASGVTPVITGTTLSGTTQGTLNLSIPLYPGPEVKVDGKAKLNNAQLTVNRMGLKVDRIKGDIKFNNQGIYSDVIQGVALGHPIQANIEQGDQQTLINVDGKAKVEDIKSLFGWQDWQQAEGEGAYGLQLHIPRAELDSNPLQLDIKSTLEGVALNLPGILTKTKDQAKPTSMTISLNDPLALPLTLDYNNELKAAINLNSNDKTINSGHILLGKGEARQPKVPGIKLEINREQLNLQDWLAVAAAQQTNTPSFNINEVKMHSQTAMLNKTRLGVFDLALKRGPSFWSGEIDSAIARGKLQFPFEMKGVTPIVMDMEMLSLTALKQLDMQGGPSVGNGFKPLLKIQSKKTLWQRENLGELILETERTQNGIKITRLELLGADEKLFSKGNWREVGLSSTTQLNGKLEMKKADELFDKLNITKDFTNTSGVIDYKLNWNAAPWQLAVANLRGTMDVKLNNGRILSIEPGFGRVLGILAVAQWIKRLQLDFGDIYEEGLTFDSIKGHFDLLNGKATTKDLTIDAVPAKITIIGDTDLVNHTVDYVIKVVPKSLDAVPIAGTIVSRIAAMVGKTLTGKDQEGFFFGTQYLVKGHWDDIKISSQHENDGLFQKTWNSITDFPWQEQKKQ